MERETEEWLFQETSQTSVTTQNKTTASTLLLRGMRHSSPAGWRSPSPAVRLRHGVMMAQGTGAQRPSVGSLLPEQPPSSTCMSCVACASSKTIVFAVPELVISERVLASTARSVIRLLAGHWKMDVLFTFMQAVNSAAIWLHEFTSLAAE